ncbi:MAG TPA: IgGFc-binding protein [Kofleriaceae bacterium]|nr:IgGFc-binding protein [Kofleriaceae bacterium]
MGSCTAGQMHCEGMVLQTCVDGQFKDDQTCAYACVESLGCQVCAPNVGECQGSVAHTCNASGTGYTDTNCDPLLGETCDGGLCTGPCAPQQIGKSYIGCEYYPTITGNEVDDNFAFAVAVSNTSTDPADVTIDGGGIGAPIKFTVQPGDVKAQPLPWNDLKLCHANGSFGGCGGTQNKNDYLAAKGAFHLRSNRPVTVYQFSPLDYGTGGSFSYTNDASLLIPVNAWTGSYVVAAYPAWTFSGGGVYPGLMTITASKDNTHLTIISKTTTPGGPSSPVMMQNIPTDVTLNAGDALELQTYAGDFTGSLVSADQPVQVIGGHDCTFVPPTIGYCDHLEESMFPVETLSTKYVIAAPSVPAAGFENGKVEVVRIVGTAAGTKLTYDPPQVGAPTVVPNGGFVEIKNNKESFFVSANHKVLVSQYMEGQDAGGNTGDPAMAIAVAVDQYRMSYLFHAPTNYEVNYVQITAPVGATVMLDGAAVTDTFTPIGSSGFAVARTKLSNAGTGNHSMTGDMPFGIQVYGYGQYTSYWYPGGLNLVDIPVN